MTFSLLMTAVYLVAFGTLWLEVESDRSADAAPPAVFVYPAD